MKLIVNGEGYEPKGADSVLSLLEEIGMDRQRVAVLVNDEVVPAGARLGRPLRDGDRIEVVSFVGGG